MQWRNNKPDKARIYSKREIRKFCWFPTRTTDGTWTVWLEYVIHRQTYHGEERGGWFTDEIVKL